MSGTLKFRKIDYRKLNGRQQENYNFQKVSGVLADYGFSTIRLSDDWKGADFLAQHVDGKTLLRVQLKGRLRIDQKYLRRDLWICFPHGKDWYLYPHDKVSFHLLKTTNIKNTVGWRRGHAWDWKRPPRRIKEYLRPFLLK